MGALLSAVSGMTSPARANDARITHLEGTHGCLADDFREAITGPGFGGKFEGATLAGSAPACVSSSRNKRHAETIVI